MKRVLFLLIILVIGGISMTFGANSIEYELKSPNGVIEIKINVGDEIMYSVRHGNSVIIDNSQN